MSRGVRVGGTQDDGNYWETVVVRNEECVCVPDTDCNCVIL